MRNWMGRAAVAALLAGLVGCASAPPPIIDTESDPVYLSDIYQCLRGSRHAEERGALTSGRVEAHVYNDCMRQRGWRTDAALATEGSAG